MSYHFVFDIAAATGALLVTLAVVRFRLNPAQGFNTPSPDPRYLVALVAGAVLGGFGFGSLNLWLSGVDAMGRSTLGALAGAIAAIEIYKKVKKIKGSTGLIFVAGFSTSIAVGRIGCFLAGLDDHTYGTLTALPWGHDFGDGALRHPVQLYESFTMAGFLGYALIALARRDRFFMTHGFYLMTGFYAAQRFVWEFFKPYAPLLGPLNLFHFICLALIAYAGVMIAGGRRV